MAPYKYESLSSPSTQIRLLELLPGHGTIECRLKVTELEQAEYTYEPISYCWKSYSLEHWWGCTYKEKKNQDKDFRILIDGADFDIYESLHGALSKFRLSTGVRVLWADAICIDQENTDEKNAQVPLMASIYKKGKGTLAWLGEADHHTRKAFEYLKGNARRHSDTFSLSSQPEQPEAELVCGNTLSHDAPVHRRCLRDLWASFNKTRLRVSLESIINRPYFRRAWIVQEITKSWSLSLICGDFEMEWRLLSDESLGIIPEFGGDSCFTALDKLRNEQYQYDLMEVASMVSLTQASRAHDKLYGILGLVPGDLMTVKIHVDYKKDPDDVFYDFSKELLIASRKLGVLCMSYGMSPDRPKHVPSWVWNPQPGEPHTRFLVPSSRSNQYHAAADTQWQPEFSGKKLERFEKLGLRGIVLQNVTTVSSGWNTLPRSSLPFYMEDPRPFLQQVLWYFEHRAIGGINKGSNGLVTAENRRDILFRTTWPYKFSTETPLPECDQLEEVRTIAKLTRFDSEIVKRFGRYIPGEKKQMTSWARFKLLVAIEAFLIRRALGNPAAKQFDRLVPSFSYLNNRRLARTDAGDIALCPKETAVNDKIVLLQGSDVPFVLRPTGDNWRIVGECYVHTLMRGWAWDESRCEKLWIE